MLGLQKQTAGARAMQTQAENVCKRVQQVNEMNIQKKKTQAPPTLFLKSRPQKDGEGPGVVC